MSQTAQKRYISLDLQPVRKLPARQFFSSKLEAEEHEAKEHQAEAPEKSDVSAAVLEYLDAAGIEGVSRRNPSTDSEIDADRESDVPESYIREIRPAEEEPEGLRAVPIPPPEPTNVYWPPPKVHAAVDPRTKVQYGPVPEPPRMTFFRWLRLALFGS